MFFILQERVRIIHENNPSFAKGHLDQDPVARVCGRDTRGHVKGMGSGISKYAISRSAPYKRALEQEKKFNVILHTEVEQLKEHVREMQQLLASHGGGHMRFSSNHGSSSQVLYLFYINNIFPNIIKYPIDELPTFPNI